MRHLWLLVGLLAIGWSQVAFAVPIQWTIESGGNGHWYDKVFGSFLWDEAMADAESRGGYIATPTSQAEWDFVKSYYSVWHVPPLSQSRMGWLGAYQTNPGGPNLDSWGVRRALVIYRMEWRRTQRRKLRELPRHLVP